MNNCSIVLHYQQNYGYDISSLVIGGINRIRSLINVAVKCSKIVAATIHPNR